MDSTYNLLIPLTVCGFRSQFRIPQPLNVTIHMSYRLLWIPETVLNSANTAAESANLPVFGAILTSTIFWAFVCGIQKKTKTESDFDLLRNPFTMHRMASLAS